MPGPFDWALTCGRLFGVPLRLHILIPVLLLPIAYRLNLHVAGTMSPMEVVCLAILLPFVLALVHVAGHILSLRSFGLAAEPMIVGPLGELNLSSAGLPWRVQLQIACSGVTATMLVCVACGLALLAGRFSPVTMADLLANPVAAGVEHLDDGRTYGSAAIVRYYRPGTADAVPAVNVTAAADGTLHVKDAPAEPVEKAVAPAWVTWVWRTGWLAFWFGVLNVLVPAMPLDGGRLLLALICHRHDGVTAMSTAGFLGLGTALIVLMAGFALNESIVVGVALLLTMCNYIIVKAVDHFRNEAEEDDEPTSEFAVAVEDDDTPAPAPPRRPGLWRRWRQAREIRRLKQEHEAAFAEEDRVDALLDKIAKSGKQSLTDEERRFLERASRRYKNRL